MIATRCTSRFTHKLIAYNSPLQVVSSYFLAVFSYISTGALPVSQPGRQDGQNCNREDIKNCDSQLDAFDQNSFVTPHNRIYSVLTDTQLPYCHEGGRGLRAVFLTSSMAYC